MAGIGAILLGVLYAILVGAVLLLAGAIIAWIAAKFGWPIDAMVQKLYLLVVLLIVVYYIIAAVLGLPTLPFRR
jgi:hypothetical protein